jgi:hypothetical protein
MTVEFNVVFRNAVEIRPRRFGVERNPAVWKVFCRPKVVDTSEAVETYLVEPSPWTVETKLVLRNGVERNPAVWYPY